MAIKNDGNSGFRATPNQMDASQAETETAGKTEGADPTSESAQLAADLFDNKGRKKFSSVSKVVAYVRDEIGKDELPPDSTIRSHIVAWIKKKAPRP